MSICLVCFRWNRRIKEGICLLKQRYIWLIVFNKDFIWGDVMGRVVNKLKFCTNIISFIIYLLWSWFKGLVEQKWILQHVFFEILWTDILRFKTVSHTISFTEIFLIKYSHELLIYELTIDWGFEIK